MGYLEDLLEPVEIEESGNKSKLSRSEISTSRWCNALIRALDAHDFSVIGEKGSYIDGSNVYDPLGEQSCRGPHGMSIWRCKNMHFEGYTKPVFLVGTDDKENVESVRSGELKLRDATFEECIEAHPGGITPLDMGKWIFWNLKDPDAPPSKGKNT